MDNKRNGQRKSREQLSKHRIPELGYYFIVTDTKKTEQLYLNGLRDSIPKELQYRLVIKVVKTDTSKLVEEALRLAAINPNYSEPWIVFDRDQVKDFDNIILQANQSGIKVGWSNPCIEIWFSAYLGVMPTYKDSVACCDGFENDYRKATKQRYDKSDADIYKKLCNFGDEKTAIKLAEQKFNEQIRNGCNKPSKMCPATTLYLLVKEIRQKIADRV